MSCVCLSLVYLNVTDLNTYNVGYDSFCLRWAPHRAATSYRLKVNPFDSKFSYPVTRHSNVLEPVAESLSSFLSFSLQERGSGDHRQRLREQLLL